MSTIEGRKKLEVNRAEILRHAETHDREAAGAREKLSAIKKQRESGDHVEKVLARDTGAIRADEKLAQEQTQLEREISLRSNVAADLRSKVSVIDDAIAKLKLVELVEDAAELAALCKTISAEATVAIAGIVPIFGKLRTHVAGLRSKLKDLPPDAQRQVQSFIDELQKFPGFLLLGQLGTVFAESGMPLPLPGDVMNRNIVSYLDDVRATLQTLAISRMGGVVSDGRKMFRAIQNVSGGRGGMSLQVGDVVALDPNDEGTKKLLGFRAIAPIEEKSSSAGAV
jgi:hypothetical protein